MGLRASERCTTTVVVLNHPEVALPHPLHLHSIWQKNLKSRKEVKVIWQINGNSLPFRQIWRHFRYSIRGEEEGEVTANLPLLVIRRAVRREGEEEAALARDRSNTLSIDRLVGVGFSSLLVSLGIFFFSFEFFWGWGVAFVVPFQVVILQRGRRDCNNNTSNVNYSPHPRNVHACV
jgi:hypothetical protein